MFCSFCGDQIAGEACTKPACREQLSVATATLAEPGPTVVVPAPEPRLAPPPPPITGARPRPVVEASVEQVMTARARLWSDLDASRALVAQIEAAATAAAGAPAAGVPAHARLTPEATLLAELRAIESAVAAESRRIPQLEDEIRANEAEIARLKRNRMLMIAGIAACVLLVLILIATAL